jgi:hypothetical protein
MLEPHIKYLCGRRNNLFCVINHNQHCAKISSCTVFNGNATKRVFVRSDGLLRAPFQRRSSASLIARSGQRGFAPAVARLACCGRLAGPPPPHRFFAPPAHVALKAYVINICVKCFRCSRCMLQVFHMDVAKK